MSLIKNANKLELHWLAGQAGLVGLDSGAILLEDKDFELSGTSATDTDVPMIRIRGWPLRRQVLGPIR
ncbi:hypothetical protein LCGC14_1797220 [marine sediment metagenome]|uniref:Uncharacterized protein n=1 Tax=marine sediment metagenome TaxID=412755 RepID=A0A0F9GQS5_9ZZZZ